MKKQEAVLIKRLFRLHVGKDIGTQKDFNDLFYRVYKTAKNTLKENDLIVEK
jgi:hypothetical protein